MKYDDIPIIKLSLTAISSHLANAQFHLQEAADSADWSPEIQTAIADTFVRVGKVVDKLTKVQQELDTQVDKLFEELMP